MYKRTKLEGSGGWLKKNARWLLCFVAKSNTEKFDKADTAQSEIFIQFSAIFYSNTPVRSVHTVWESSWDLRVELFTQINHASECFKMHATTKLHADWHLNWFK